MKGPRTDAAHRDEDSAHPDGASARRDGEPGSRWVFSPESAGAGSASVPGPQSLGGKGHHLSRLVAAGAAVPPFVVLQTGAFRAHGASGLLPPSLLGTIRAALARAGLEGTPLAVRSSAAEEDGVHASFAGQFDTVLGVRWEGAGGRRRSGEDEGDGGDGDDGDDELARAILQVWASASSTHARAYRAMSATRASAGAPQAAAAPDAADALDAAEAPDAADSGPEGDTAHVPDSGPEDDTAAAPVPMAVVLQAMVDARASGVAFSVDPVQGRRHVTVVSAVRGLGEPLVSGELDGDTHEVHFDPDDVDADPEVRSTVRPQPHKLRLAPDGSGGTERVELDPDDPPQPVPDPRQVIEIARMARRLAHTFEAPQDVEWALDPDGKLVVLQARPITALPEPPAEPDGGLEPGPPLESGPPSGTDPDLPREGARRIWDNSNIIESYSGVTTPLTFSFARSVYREVYVQFCRLLGVSETLLTEQRHVFANMLGLVRGRIYYNLLNWYRLIALLPGYDANRAFMERMMGVEEALGDPPPPPRAGARWRDTGRVIRMMARMTREYWRLNREVARFHTRLDTELGPLAGEDLRERSPDELLTLYRHLEDTLLHHWRAPLVNDFFAMIVFGVLGRLTESWLPDEPPTLANDLLCGEGGVISTEPARRIMALAQAVVEDDALAARFRSEPDDARLWSELVEVEKGDQPPHPGFRTELLRYLGDFGDRCMNELKLETVTPHEDPAFVLEMVRAYVAVQAIDPKAVDTEAGTAREQRIRSDAEARVRARLRGPRRWVYRWVLGQSRQRIRDRENLRFERTRVFGVVRRIVVALGHHLARAGRLDDPQHVFYLTLDELFQHVEGTGVTADLARLARLRRAEFAGFEAEPDPPARFETVGPPARGSVPRPDGGGGRRGAGRGASPGDDPGAGPVDGSETRELSGLGCCPGLVRAPVRVVTDPRHPGELTGHILVAARTDPGWTLLFPRAKGILVERGSLLSHSAIVAREMGLPCVVGVGGLMTTLEDGEVVEMDGTTGRIRRVDS